MKTEWANLEEVTTVLGARNSILDGGRNCIERRNAYGEKIVYVCFNFCCYLKTS